MTNTRASLRSDNCPTSIGMSVRFELEHVSDFVGMRSNKLPAYEDLAGYVFYTATGDEFNARKINRKTGFIGESAKYDVYLFYEPDMEYLKATALTLNLARQLSKGSGKKRLVFAPTKYLDGIHLEEHRIEFCQLPFEIYKSVKPKK